MDTGKVYYDSEGNERSIWQMVKEEPTWAAVRIQEGEKAAEQLTTAQAEIEVLRGRVQYLEASIKNAIGWIDGDLRDIIRDVGSQICNYNDLYESADRIEHLLAEALRQQASESEHG